MTIFAEHEKAKALLFQRNKMYLLLEGEVDLVAGKKVIGTVGMGQMLTDLNMTLMPTRTARISGVAFDSSGSRSRAGW